MWSKPFTAPLEFNKLCAGRETDLPEEDRIRLRIGVNLGDVIVEGSDIYGDGVNVAARLEGLAEPGSVCISGTVFDHVKAKVDLEFVDLEISGSKISNSRFKFIRPRWALRRERMPVPVISLEKLLCSSCLTSLPLPFYRSTICPATLNRNISPMVWQKI